MVASYQGGAISLAEYERVVATKAKHVRLILAKDDARRKELLESMVEFEILLLEAERRGYAEHPAVKFAMRDAAVSRLLEGALTVAPESVGKAEIEAAYVSRADEFKRAEQRRARHVVLATEAEAVALIAEARKSGPRADELIARAARERSLDEATKRQGGELGMFAASGKRSGADSMVAPELVKAAFAVRAEGQVAPKPIPTQGGFSVLVVTGRIAATTIEPAVARDTIRAELATKSTQQAVETLVADLQKANPIEKHVERIEWVTLDPPASAGIPRGFPAAPQDPTAPPVIVEPDGF